MLMIFVLTTTENPPNVQNLIRFPVHIAFSIIIIDIRKPPKEQFLWRFWCARLDSNQRSHLPARSELNGLHRRPAPHRVGVIRPSRRKPRFHAGFEYIAQNEQTFAKIAGALGTPGLPRFFRFWENSSQTVVRGWAERKKSLGERGGSRRKEPQPSSSILIPYFASQRQTAKIQNKSVVKQIA